LARSTQIHSLKTVPSNLGLDNNVQVNNKSQIVLLAENSTETNDNFTFKEQYELQNETGFYTFNLYLKKKIIYLFMYLQIYLINQTTHIQISHLYRKFQVI